MQGKLAVPGRAINLDDSRTRACNRCGLGLFGHFSLVYLFSFLLLLRETDRYRLKYCLKGPLNPKQTTNFPVGVDKISN